MAKRLTFSETYPYSAETIFQNGSKKDYIEAESVHLEQHDPAILELHDGPDGGGARFKYQIDTELPSWAAKLFQPRNTVTEVHTWPGAAPDGRRGYSYTVDIANVPAKVNGSTSIIPTGDSTARVDTVVEVSSKMPLVGGKVEDLVAKQLGETVEQKMAFMHIWLDKQA